MRVVVSGIGVVSPVGVGIQHAWKTLIASKCGIVKLGPEFDSVPSKVAGLVPKGSDPGEWDPTQWIDAKNLRKTPLFIQYALSAAKQALDDGNWHPESEQDKKDTGVAIGSGIGGFEAVYDNAVAFHEGGYRKVSPMFVPGLLVNMAAGNVSIAHGLRGPNHAVSTACTTGAHAIGDAAGFIKNGMAKVMLAGSTEGCVHPLAVAGFARARALASSFNDTPEKASRPFDSDRGGFVIGEGAAVLLLEEESHAKNRGAKIYAEVSGYGLSGDGHHITAPEPNGSGAYDCMTMALDAAGLNGSDIDYVNAHATSTPLGDAIESKAIVRALGKPSSEINVSSTKGATGHLLGAAGSLEAAFTVMALHTQTMPPNLNLETVGEGFDCNYIKTATEGSINHAMSNSFGFGGTNASLVFSKSQ
ncbi:3-oxoacyl-[acyl-carrier-protein] synthase, mitochondrial [Wickerhamiella sorbophila]|uniref:3-oxoacyl-[acyl-carrier-protein] synthase n=1 Tax=Wickerhamiella sorbophila TaxID=45607 RepID=A0A2T0FP08_9ASCO|nr:3-oxoacyl-[acyl-carrier-protein] synthase, mitochondrial [Wickerhamiella sorbophila]PRT56717.1 3-oxoacyl-[acyl-carrier-protein] synthase, mitochondrial [Wickerhamiella sorbophila]